MNKATHIITVLAALIAAGCSLCVFFMGLDTYDSHRNTPRYLAKEIYEAQRNVICALEGDLERIYIKDLKESVKSIQSSLGIPTEGQTRDDELNAIQKSLEALKDDVAEIKEILEENRPMSGPAFEPLLPQRRR